MRGGRRGTGGGGGCEDREEEKGRGEKGSARTLGLALGPKRRLTPTARSSRWRGSESAWRGGEGGGSWRRKKTVVWV